MSSLERRVASVAGARPVAWDRRTGGWTANERWSVALEDGRRVFVKHAVADLLAEFLREEHRFYLEVRAPFMPEPSLAAGWDEVAATREPFLSLGLVRARADEGEPQPHDVLPNAPEYAALVSGFFAVRAGLPPPPTAPAVRDVQRRQLVVALGWARRELDL